MTFSRSTFSDYFSISRLHRLTRVGAVCGALVVCAVVWPAQSEAQPSTKSKHFMSTTPFMLYNTLGTDDNPSFYQLNYGYRWTPKDTLIVEAITWQYYGPLGVPLYKLSTENTFLFPGRVREFGVGLAYQRYLWKGAYAALHALPLVQRYYDEEDNFIQTGFQLFMTARIGYHFDVWDDLFFIEPSVACTAWPINTNEPADFAKVEDEWPSYLLFEPGLMVGVNF